MPTKTLVSGSLDDAGLLQVGLDECRPLGCWSLGILPWYGPSSSQYHGQYRYTSLGL